MSTLAVTPTSVTNMSIFPIFPNLPFKNICVTNWECGQAFIRHGGFHEILSSCIIGTVWVSIFGAWPSVFSLSYFIICICPSPGLYWSTPPHHQKNSLLGLFPSQTSSHRYNISRCFPHLTFQNTTVRTWGSGAHIITMTEEKLVKLTCSSLLLAIMCFAASQLDATPGDFY